MYRISAVILAFVAAVMIPGCATTAQTAVQPDQPDAGFPYRRSPEPVPVELRDPFIRLVNLAQLRVGMTKAEVLAIFPDPRTINVSPRGLEVWEYGFAQLHFRNGLLANWFDLTRNR
jgi:outer membrane protein assembly factor BamE (lipoprotein component of BamABCDE complex)